MIVRAQVLPYSCAGFMESYGVQGFPNSVFFWEVDGGTIISGQGNDTIIVRWDQNRRTHSIAVTEESEFGCFGEPVGATLTITGPVAEIGDDVGICQNDAFDFDATTTYETDVSYLWPDGSTGATYSGSQDGYVWVKVTGTDLCYDYDSVYLTVNALPVVDLGPDTTLCGTQTMALDAGFFSSYQWSTGDIVNPITVDGQRTEPETIWVEVTDGNGCRGGDTITLEVCDAMVLFANMPNTITPGDEGHNNEWIIPYIDLFPDAVLEIFDRWGRLVFRTDDIANNWWKGENMAGKELPMDAYFFVIDLKIAHVKPVTGYVNVIR